MRRLALALWAVVLAACGEPKPEASAPWRTVFDSTGDTIAARTTGDVPNELVRGLLLEQRIGDAEGSDSVTFGQVAYVAVTPDDRIFVFDTQGPTLKLFDSTGTLVRFVGRKGGGPGEFEQVTGLATLPNGGLALWDASHARVNIYDATGAFQTQWRVPVSGYYTYNGLFTDREGSVLLTLPLTGLRVFGESGYVRFSTTGEVRDTIRVPRWVDSTPQVLGTDASGQARVAWAIPFAPATRDTWSQAGALVSGPSTPYVAYVTHRRGRPLKIEREWTPVSTLPEEREDWSARITWNIRRTLPAWNWPGTDIPATKPAYAGLLTSDDGRIWVALHSPAEKNDDDGGEASRGQQPPPRPRYREPNVYDIFAAEGVYLGRVRTGPNDRIMRMRGDRVWGLLSDSVGVQYVARWRLEPPFAAPRAAREPL